MPEKTLVIKKMYSVSRTEPMDDFAACTVSLCSVNGDKVEHVETLTGKVNKPWSRDGYYSRKLDVPEDAEVRWYSTTQIAPWKSR